jgi:hypothetical protein
MHGRYSTQISKILITVLLVWVGHGNADMNFVHPGAWDSKDSLGIVKARILAGDQPWKGEFNKIRDSAAATRGPSELTHIVSSADASVARDDALAAYTQALLWYFTDDETYARRSIAILNAWSNLQGFTLGTDQDKLRAGWIGAVFAPAAEIMRGYSGWTSEQTTDFQAMFKRAFYPQLSTASHWNGNVDLTQIDAMMSIFVFIEDEALFEMGLERLRLRTPAYFYLTTDGVPVFIRQRGHLQQNHTNCQPFQHIRGGLQPLSNSSGAACICAWRAWFQPGAEIRA